jgi:hypothetical protein
MRMDHKIPPQWTGQTIPSLAHGRKTTATGSSMVKSWMHKAARVIRAKREAPTLTARLKTLGRCMSINKHKAMASECLAEQQAEQAAGQAVKP